MRLWLSNRRLRKHEVIEEERRARLAEMRHCGIDAPPSLNEIPFGVRALESGVEVEGIWISRSNTPDGCHTPSSAAPADDHAGPKGKARMPAWRQDHSPDAPPPTLARRSASGDAALYGAAEVYANRNTRRLNAGFEVLPAGILGPRQEFLAHGGANEAGSGRGQSSRLQKKVRG